MLGRPLLFIVENNEKWKTQAGVSIVINGYV
jgi:hypothetical protein